MGKKGLYLIFEDEDELKKDSPGIYKKIINQMEVFRFYNLEIESCFIPPSSTLVGKISRRLPYNFGSKRLKLNNFGKIDYLYVRRTQLNYAIYSFLLNLKTEHKCTIIWEIPTYPYDDECKINFKNHMIHQKDRKYRNKLRGVVDRIVTFSKDDFIWNIETLKICNGIEVSKIDAVKIKNVDEINMIAVASLNYWHGYDRLIEGLGRFKRSNPEKISSIKFHLVGDGPVLNPYKDLVNTLGLKENVIFYGNLYGEALDEVYNKASLGIDALGRHRSGVYYNSSLKGKEYCAKGLPVVSGVCTELDDQLNFPYYLRFPADDTPIDIQVIVDFYEKIYYVGQKKVADDIRVFAEEHFDLFKTLKPIVEYINMNTSSISSLQLN